MCRNRCKYCISAPVLCYKSVLNKLLLNLLNICIRLIYLINRNNYINACCLGMVDSLYSLWHYTIISRNDKNRYICCLCSTHSHCRECLMSRCIKEGNLLAIYLNCVCTDVLCDTTGLSRCDTG